MTTLADYQDRFKSVVFRREDGILEMRFHTDGGPLRWGFLPHEELEEAFLQVGRDRENKVVIMTGTGDEFSESKIIRKKERPRCPYSRSWKAFFLRWNRLLGFAGKSFEGSGRCKKT